MAGATAVQLGLAFASFENSTGTIGRCFYLAICARGGAVQPEYVEAEPRRVN